MQDLTYNSADDGFALPGWAVRPTAAVQLLIATSFMLLWLVAEVVSRRFLTAGGVSGWYPTAGLGVALLWALGLRYAWVIVPASLLGGLAVWEYAYLPAALVAMMKGLTYAGAAVVLRRVLPPGRLPRRPIDLAAVIAALLACAILTAGGGVALLAMTGEIGAEFVADAVVGWAVGDAVGMLVTAPLLVMVLAPWLCLRLCKAGDEAKLRYARTIGSYELFRGYGPWLMIVAASLGLAVLSCLPERCDPRVYYLGFVALPALAMRYRLAGGLAALLLLSFTGVFAAKLHGIDPPLLTDLQLIFIALSISTILVGSFAVMRAWAEEQRRAEHRWAALAMRGSGMGRWYWEVGSDQLTTDHVLTDSFGYRRDRVSPRLAWWEQRIHPEDVLLNKRETQRLLTGETDYFEVENRMLAADGSWGWYHSQGTVIDRDAQGRPRRIAGTHHDITERKELEQLRADAEATRRSEQRFRTLADDAPVAIFQTDAKGVFLYVNPAWRRMTGHEQTDALYRSAAAFAHPEDRDRVADHWATAVQTGTPVNYEHRVVTPDGRTLWIQTQATANTHNGVLIGYVGTGVDVTPYREAMAMIRDSEARYRTLADHAYDMLWRVSAQGVFTYVSPSITKLMGFEPEEVVGTDAFSYFHPDDLERVRGKHAKLAPESPEFEDVHRYRRKDGSYIVFEAVGKLVVPEQQDKPAYITGISRDVTQRVESERIQRELEEKLARSQKLDAIGTFATGIAHDFRNSLLAIKASAQSAERKLEQGHPALPALDTVEDACAQAMQVTQSLLTFARGQGATKRVTDLSQLVRDNTRLLQAVLPPGVRLRWDGPDTPVKVHANAGEIQQAMLNLVMNAKDALADRTDGEIRLSLSQLADKAVLSVADNGCGMSDQVLGRALEPFFTTRARLKGTGLGLSQVHGIVTDHGGEITLDSTPGRGTTITITLPTRPTPNAKQPHDTTTPTQTEAATP
ncbi:MAG: PAS domain S-box protein [Phycisphaeraceae bacterium]